MDISKEKRKHKSLPSYEEYQRDLAWRLFIRNAAHNAWSNVLLFLREVPKFILAVAIAISIILGILGVFDIVMPSDYETFQSTYDECLRVDSFTPEQCFDIAIAGSRYGN